MGQCAHPSYRLPSDALAVSHLWHRYSDRIYRDGVFIQRPELEFVRIFDPRLADAAQVIPCCNCIQCKMNESLQWTLRCVAEASLYKNCNSFLTLTYDDDHLSFDKHYDFLTGEVDYRPVLVKKDLQDFMKRLRRHFEYNLDLHNIRFFACGEYGSLTSRPHFHVLLFNCEFDQLHVWQDKGHGNISFTSDRLDDLWGNGIATIGPVDWHTSAYTARYVMKKADDGDLSQRIDKALQRWAADEWNPYRFPVLLGKLADERGIPHQLGARVDYWREIYEASKDSNFQYEFTQMSRRPGIGREYYDERKDQIYATDEVFLPGRFGVQPQKPPKYYDRLYDVEYPSEMKIIKNKRVSVAKNAMSGRLSRTDLSEEEYLLMQERKMQDKVKKLIRPL